MSMKMASCLITFLLLAFITQAAVQVYEGFGDALNNTTLAGYSGSSAEFGLTGIWSVTGGAQVTISRLPWEYVGISDGYAPETSGGNQHWWEAAHWSTSIATRPLSGTIDLSVDGTLYMSFFTKCSNADIVVQIGLSNATNELMVGNAYTNTASKGLTAYYGTNANEITGRQANCNGTYVSYASNQTGLYVIKLVKRNSGTTNDLDVSIKFYNLGVLSSPTNTIDMSDPATWSRSLTLAGVTDVFDTLKLKLDGYTPSMDEIRIGQTFADVTIGIKGALNPSPANGATNVDPVTTTQISWDISTEPGVTGQKLYWAEGEPNFVGAPASLSATTNAVHKTMAMDKVYFWRVDTGINNEPNKTIQGEVWSFSTSKTVPVITADPVNTTVFIGDTASYNAGFGSISTPTVSWYKYGDPNTLLVSQTGTGSTTSGDYTAIVTMNSGVDYTTQLQIANTELADEGTYFCTVTNAAGSDMSLTAILTLNRLVAYYPFDVDPNDVAGNADPVMIANKPTYVTGVPNYGQAISFNGSNQYVLLDPNTQYPKPGLGGAFETGTVSLWVKVNAATTAESHIFGAYMGVYGGGPAYDMWFNTGATDITFRLRPNSGTYESSPSPFTSYVGNNKWHLITVTYKKDVGLEMFLDGVSVNTAAYTAAPVFNPWAYGLAIGASNTRGVIGNYFTGSVDDLRIYNYRLTVDEIRDLYRAAYGYVCVTSSYEAAYDFNDDCKVDFADFAAIAAEWLSCGREPVVNCGL